MAIVSSSGEGYDADEAILHWELKQTDVSVTHYPRLMEYLGHCPVSRRAEPSTLGELGRLHRTHRGLTLREASAKIGVDPGALITNGKLVWRNRWRILWRSSDSSFSLWASETIFPFGSPQT